MKKFILGLIILTTITGCRGCFANYEERRAGVQKVCPTCDFVLSENTYYAVDTIKKPNIIYRVVFKEGGLYYKASEVSQLIRVN